MNNTTDNIKLKKPGVNRAVKLLKAVQMQINQGVQRKRMNITHDAGILQNKRRIQRLHLILSSRDFYEMFLMMHFWYQGAGTDAHR